MRTDEKITKYESICLFVTVFLSSLFNDYFAILGQFIGTSAWISQIIGATLSVIQLFLLISLLKKYENKDILEIFDAVCGKVIGKILVIFLILYFICNSTLSLSQLVKFIEVYTYTNTSHLFNGLVIMIAVGVFARYSIKGLAKTVSIALPLVLIVWTVILTFSYEQYDLYLLNPILGYGVKRTVSAGLQLIAEYSGIFVLAVFAKSIGSSKEFKRSGLISTAIAGFAYLATTFCFNIATPYSSISTVSSGIVWMAQSTYINRFIQKSEPLFISVTITAILLILGINFLAMIKSYCHLFTIENEHSSSLVLPFALILIAIMINIKTTPELGSTFLIMRRVGAFVCMGLIGLLLVVSNIKNRVSRYKDKKRLHSPKRIMRYMSLVLVFVTILGMFSSCNTDREPDSNIYPIILGFDKGKVEKYSITMKLMSLINAEDGGVSNGDNDLDEGIPHSVVVLESPTLIDAINGMKALLPKKISFLQLKMMIISEELAEEGIDSFINHKLIVSGIKPTMSILVSKCSAYDLIAAEGSSMTDMLPIDIEMVLEPDKESTIYVVQSMATIYSNYNSTYGDFFTMYGNVNHNDFKKDEDESDHPPDIIGNTTSTLDDGYLPGNMPYMGNSRMEFAGAAVFKSGRMVGSLNSKECQTLALLDDEVEFTYLSFRDPKDEEDYISLLFRKDLPTGYSTTISEDGQIDISLFISVDASLVSVQRFDSNYSNDIDAKNQLKDYIENSMEERSDSLIDKLQHEYEADIMQIGRKVSKNFLTIQEWEEFHWTDQFKNANITVEYNVNL